ncbi:putative P-loop containing nucleoside triphosphate hydrolase [Rosa chinensis]|uniref:Putative P-loop containing nucleoside triphosphate hydrolase n=1 Tax=Rosa chinensis TaxID=74649 RepID=A0A2P6SBE1_ROSCH|nr:putative P-loop containing nucleoside triphosphate hydrolase [Rosa chinensis]
MFIDEIHTVVGAGGLQIDAGNLLKPMLGWGELRCIGATTLNEHRKYVEKDPALERGFQQVFCGYPFSVAIDLVDEAAAKLKMEITSKPTELDEVDRAVLKLEMEKLSLQNDTDKLWKERLSKMESDLALLKQKQTVGS